MNQQLIKDIQERVKQVNAERADESVLAAHLDAMSEVYDTDRATVELLAREVIAERSSKARRLDFDKLRNTLWVCALVLIIISVIWLLYNNLQTRPEASGLSKSETRKVGYVAEALASLNVVKVMIAENVAVTGRIASTFEEIGVKEDELVLTKYIDRIRLSENGAIVVELSKLVGDDQYIKLIPLVRTASYQLEWDCRSNLEQVILDEINGCTPD